MFGAHVGAFMGGQLRIENTELFRTGQAANLGRYSSHWHVLSSGRNVDVMDIAYLRNNSYHDTFQRAVVVHSTDYATVMHNVAYHVRGHMFFTETGQEHYALFEHNLAVEPLPHHLLLDDDETPAGFWLPGFTGWHRSNLAVNCHRGWRVRKLEGVASEQTDLTFFNNSAHACGFGWHLKPPHAPPTMNTFQTFTAFRCATGMFYPKRRVASRRGPPPPPGAAQQSPGKLQGWSVRWGAPNGAVTTPCGESAAIRGHCTVLGLGSLSEDVSGDGGLQGPKTVR
ncbi:unnamed protein product [Prorocentrum cordatum]|uniref:CEMIP beta-helix domain-containing protein n=1 Tax=Prorocentrum cordatum TaxID=2364126 RepID=A0ABN9UPZ8_9DINO|nr:unnamed protein product [Polarella glacialis]